MNTNGESFAPGVSITPDELQSIQSTNPTPDSATHDRIGRSSATPAGIVQGASADSRDIGWHVRQNIERVALPVIRSLKQRVTAADLTQLDLLEKCLKDITAGFIDRVASEFVVLSPRELNICYMIANGMSSKEIAEVLSVGSQTVIKYRKVIRKKLHISRQSVNLAMYLQDVRTKSCAIAK